MHPPTQMREHVPLKEYCTLGIGGPARYFIEARTTAELQEALLFFKHLGINYLILGKGSNTLFADQGYNGGVILNKIDFLDEPVPGTFHAGAGYSFSLLGIQTARQGWGGLEFASGIPGTVGGAVWMNAGANGNETCQTLTSVDYINDQGKQTIQKKDLTFGYRTSSFQSMKGAIVGATFTLAPEKNARSKQIDIVKYRIQTQPYKEKSAGCIFRNPVLGSAGALIDRCGLKGTAIGGAQVSRTHGNFLINSHNASCTDMLNLIAHVKAKVKETSGVDLEHEVRYYPYEDR